MGHKHTKEEILAGALAVATDDGLSQLTFGRVAKHLAISDRVVVYYFPTKDDLITEVLVAMGLELQQMLAQAFSTTVPDHVALAKAAWPILARAESEQVFALFFEANGLAAAGREPYRTVVPQLVSAWVDWASEFIEGSPERRTAEAEAAIAIIDGLLILRLTAGVDTTDRAASTLGII